MADGYAGTVIHVDRFGNLVTSISASQVAAVTVDAQAAVKVAGHLLPLVGTYADLPPGGAGALVGSRNRLEVVVRERGDPPASAPRHPGAAQAEDAVVGDEAAPESWVDEPSLEGEVLDFSPDVAPLASLFVESLLAVVFSASWAFLRASDG